MPIKEMKVAIVHDWLVSLGGAEEVVLALHKIFPQAPIFTALLSQEGQSYFPNAHIYTSFLNKLPLAKKRREWLLPLLPFAFEQFNLKDFDLIISSSAIAAKGVITQPKQLHICYCHTPTRFLWMPQIDRRLPQNFFAKALATYLRAWDVFAAERPDVIIANSLNTQANIWKYYRRKSEVVYPPIEFKLYKQAPAARITGYYLTISRLVWQKRVDIIVKAFIKNGLPLKIVGVGREEKRLKALAKGYKNIEFLGFVDSATKRDLLSHCKAFVFMSFEDFGIAPVEALASGRPVIAYGQGGALEYVIPYKTGLLVEAQDEDVLNRAIFQFEHLTFESEACRKQAERFDFAIFQKRIKEIIARESSL